MDGLEHVPLCPYCCSPERAVAHTDVQDWSFYCAAGKWSYWRCTQCNSLYLDPRPTPVTIKLAYEYYYTHRVGVTEPFLSGIKERLRNECWSHWLNVDLRPRVHVPPTLSWLLNPLKSRLAEPFEIGELARLPIGRVMDVGCGNGRMLAVAKRLGWTVRGLEIDPAAVRVARGRGLDVVEGSYSRLDEFAGQFDCVICSHVIEHVYEPRDMLARIARALKEGGTLLLSAPNASSLVRLHFGNYWRGLEAPRHLAIPSARALEALVVASGFDCRQRTIAGLWTAAESSRMKRGAAGVTRHDRAVTRRLRAQVTFSSKYEYDFVEMACVKNSNHVE